MVDIKSTPIMAAEPKKIIIDTDPGIDDAMAIFLALKSPEVEVIGLTTIYGNVYTTLATRNALHLLEVAGRMDIPVAEGSHVTITKGTKLRIADFVHGADGLGNQNFPPPEGKAVEESAAAFLVHQAKSNPGKITVVALGPLTNIALAMQLDPSFADNIGQIVVLGGAFSVNGNVNPAAEANIFGDPDAADIVFTSGADVLAVGINVTHQVVLTAFTDKGKFLLAARRFRHGAHTEYIISLDADDISQGSNAYVGKLRSDLLGTNFTIYDSNPPHSGAKPSNCRCSRRFASKQISPQVPAGNFEVGHVSYKFNLLKSRGPRRMICSMKCPTSDDTSDSKSHYNCKMSKAELASSGYTVLRNKAPRWHEHLQCWCLNFHGRVTVASVKNFQLVATVDPSQPDGRGDEETVLLQFGKVGDDVFTMDYRQPLSAFQAFAMCLTSFGTKLACE